ncbi:hypothetical protein EN962_18275 [Mesorhizobium sp. M7A.F.Ca.CA.001.09.2.1]|uniref:Uncharacterized protein n=3 Tax=Mesorhizobium TaxID=68287 RepID=A0AB38TFF9_9HYPH|nr:MULTISPECIES: hypothetical protein [Mesorhizobium]RUY59510.1 hypothetical protein EN981_00580 [Mesorhizobium sp. M7A.F.Ca.CA.001.13.2.1]MDF3215429.1 hypothetical protein [Mesorhizobium ciceri]RUY63438.1 hypothetical protein EN965_23040 [Mesorhizobium sp. M7A.F.Ca.CA.001.05.1.1]RUY72538.1 hypothetical protein EN980_02655 [Mesorhizobium sp. M7A.F.Ca.CA.001.13.1.1]RUY76855.1 hypothetical protein EN962_18275 [Mesorhizobium sp. M7A.F.Ca.CA.001.09.2.1]
MSTRVLTLAGEILALFFDWRGPLNDTATPRSAASVSRPDFGAPRVCMLPLVVFDTYTRLQYYADMPKPTVTGVCKQALSGFSVTRIIFKILLDTFFRRVYGRMIGNPSIVILTLGEQ